jgi:DNA-binding transcriptional ArsR family regulator
MFCDQMTNAIVGARTLTRLDHLSKAIWQGLVAQAVTDEQAQQLAELIHARRLIVRGEVKPVGLAPGRPSLFPPRRLQRPLSRPLAVARRRHLAASGPMPPHLACRFTVGELAVLRILGDEIRERGHCDRTIAEMAARAGVGRTTVQNAMRAAAAMGLVTIEERRREGKVNLPNIVRVVCRDWKLWLERKADRPKRSQAQGGRVQNFRPHGQGIGFQGLTAEPGRLDLQAGRAADSGKGRGGRNQAK